MGGTRGAGGGGIGVVKAGGRWVVLFLWLSSWLVGGVVGREWWVGVGEEVLFSGGRGGKAAIYTNGKVVSFLSLHGQFCCGG